MKLTLLQSREDLDWLFDTALKAHNELRGKYPLAILTGNEDAPEKVMLYERDDINAPHVKFLQDEHGDLQRVHRFTFDVKLAATITVPAFDEQKARELLREKLECADTNAGAWPDGNPILFEASLDDVNPDLVSIDDREV